MVSIFIPEALQIYRNLTKKSSYDLNIHTYIACCLYALTKYKEGLEEAKKAVPSELNNRVRFHLAFKLSDGNEVLEAHQKLVSDSVPDELSLAALHYIKMNKKKPLIFIKKYDALNIYLAMCYYKLEFFRYFFRFSKSLFIYT